MRDQRVSILWRRLDVPGHDACQFGAEEDGYALRGTAVFLLSKRVCELRYAVFADAGFCTTRASVTGHVGKTQVDLKIRASARGRWKVNGIEQPSLAGCLDLDLGFTPATNLLPIRRLALAVGREAQAPAAYMDFPSMTFVFLPQRYRRLSHTEYDYESPTANYRGTLKVAASGFVTDYPELFRRETGA